MPFKLRHCWEYSSETQAFVPVPRPGIGAAPKMMMVWDFTLTGAATELVKMFEMRMMTKCMASDMSQRTMALGLFQMTLVFFPFFTQWKVISAHVGHFDPHLGERSSTRGGEIALSIASALLLGAIYNQRACLKPPPDWDARDCALADGFMSLNRLFLVLFLLVTAAFLQRCDLPKARTWFGVVGFHALVTATYWAICGLHYMDRERGYWWTFQMAALLDMVWPVAFLFVQKTSLPPVDTLMWVARMEGLTKAGLSCLMLSGLRAAFSTRWDRSWGENAAGFSVAIYTLACKCLYFDNLRVPSNHLAIGECIWLACWKYAHVPFVISMMLVGVSLQRHLAESRTEINPDKEELRAALLAICCSGCLWSSALVNSFCVGGSQFRFNKAIRMSPRLLAAVVLPILPEYYSSWHVDWTLQIWLPGLLMMTAVVLERCLSRPRAPLGQDGQVVRAGPGTRALSGDLDGPDDEEGLEVADLEEDSRLDRSLELAETAHTRSHSITSLYSEPRPISFAQSDPRQSFITRARVVEGTVGASSSSR